MNSKRGRPAGPSDVRDRLVSAAQSLFLAQGYDKTSVRQIAQKAEVDHTMVNYYFGSKAGLFGASMALAVTPQAAVITAFAHGADDPPQVLAERLVTAIFDVWENANTRGPFVDMLRRVMRDDALRASLADFLHTEVVRVLAERIGGQGASRRAAAIGAVLAGVIFSRYLMGIEPIASMSEQELVKTIAPMVAVNLR